MLKTRVIGVLVVKNNRVVQSIGFKKYLPVGSIEIAVEYLDRWGIDEIVILDIDATKEKRSPSAAYKLHAPLAIGGGIKTLAQIEFAVRNGADKVVINSAFLSNPEFVSEGAKQFGRQCMVVSIDAIMCSKSKTYHVLDRNEPSKQYLLIDQLKMAEDSGAGEIFLNSVDRDGMKIGYDLKLLELAKATVSLPIIICGGVGKASHLADGIKAGADAVAAGNFFHFAEHSVVLAKQKILKSHLDLRLDSYITYEKVEFDQENDRPLRLSDHEYDKLRFEYIPQDKI